MARKKFKPECFESINGAPLSATIYVSMLQSSAWMKLSNNARVLYLYMKVQYYGQHPPAGFTKYEFVFNTALYTKVYKLYTNQAQFRQDRQRLIDGGFIEVVQNGKVSRTKNIYRFSDKWKTL